MSNNNQIQNNSSWSVIKPTDWLKDRRKIREELGGEYKYIESLPKKLGRNKITSFQKIKSKMYDIEYKAFRIEQSLITKSKMSDNFLQDVSQVGSMYMDAITVFDAV